MPATSPSIKPRYCSVEAAASYSSVSRTTIYKLINQGEIDSANIGTRRVVDLESIDRYIERHKDRPALPAPESAPSPA